MALFVFILLLTGYVAVKKATWVSSGTKGVSPGDLGDILAVLLVVLAGLSIALIVRSRNDGAK